jgi:hypothetical protein
LEDLYASPPHRRTPTERALDSAKETAKDLGTRAGEAAFLLNERAQTTVIPAVEQAAKNAAERYHNEVQPLILTAATLDRRDRRPPARRPRAGGSGARAEGAHEIDRRGREALKEADKRGQQARVDALKRGLEMTEKARSVVGRRKPPKKTHRLRNLLIALGWPDSRQRSQQGERDSSHAGRAGPHPDEPAARHRGEHRGGHLRRRGAALHACDGHGRRRPHPGSG